MPKHTIIPTRQHKRAILSLMAYFESQSDLGRTLGLQRSVVNGWFTGRKIIPIAHAVRLETILCGKITALELRPDLKEKAKKGLR